MHKFVLSTISTALLMTTPSWSYQLASPLLDHINCVSQKIHEYKVSILNNEEQDIEAEIEFSGITCQKDGLAALSGELPEGITIENLNKNFYIPKGERGDFYFRIDTSKVKKDVPFSALGILVAKKEQPQKTLDSNKDKVQAGFVIRQKFLVQLMMKLQKTEIGKAEIHELEIKDDKLIFTLKNKAKHLLEGDILLFGKKGNQTTEEPLSQYVRVLPNHEREYIVDLQEHSFKDIQLFFDNPYFELLEKEIKIK